MILERGARRAVITLGNKGSVIGTKENRIPKHIPVTAVEPVDTTVMLNIQNFHTRNFPEVVSVYTLPSINMFCLLFSTFYNVSIRRVCLAIKTMCTSDRQIQMCFFLDFNQPNTINGYVRVKFLFSEVSLRNFINGRTLYINWSNILCL